METAASAVSRDAHVRQIGRACASTRRLLGESNQLIHTTATHPAVWYLVLRPGTV